MTSDLIRNGAEVRVKGIGGIKEQIYQISMDYSAIDNPLSLDWDDIIFFYRGLHNTLKQTTGKNGK